MERPAKARNGEEEGRQEGGEGRDREGRCGGSNGDGEKKMARGRGISQMDMMEYLGGDRLLG